MSASLKRWKLKNIQYDKKRDYIYCEKEGLVKMYDLTNYLTRQTKTSRDLHVYILEAVNNKTTAEAKTVHFGFKSKENYEYFKKNVDLGMENSLYYYVKSCLAPKNKVKK